jgi:glycosyltransferase involved in cell wall biosynthesis
MRIAYLGQMADVATENGISKKIGMQLAAWAKAGHEVRYFALAPTNEVWRGLPATMADVLARGHPLLRAFRSRVLCARIRQWNPQVVYFRFAHHSPGLPRLFREVPTVAEINSDDLSEYRNTLSVGKLLYHRITRSRVLAPIAGFVGVTRELAARFSHFDRPVIAIGNSIDLSAFLPLPPPEPESFRLAFLGTTGAPWHGLDRLVEIADLVPQWSVEVIGVNRSTWSQLVPVPPPANLHLHGPLLRSSYEPLLASCTAAIGSLALFRNGMEEACSLKVREYLALGLPVIGAYEDTDIASDADYFLRLPNNFEPLDPWRDRIAAFLEHWENRRVPRSSIAHLDVSVKETQRLAFMERILTASRHA